MQAYNFAHKMLTDKGLKLVNQIIINIENVEKYLKENDSLEKSDGLSKNNIWSNPS